jgi:MoaA/NifB/PqqE/SkfB family radical SAM enzyme
MDCPFCGADAGFETMDFETALDLLKELKRASLESVVLGGGEPMLWKGGLQRLAQEARRLGLLVQIGSNATRVGADPRFLKSFDRWVLPLESLPGGAHEGMRPWGPGPHALVVLQLMERLKALGVEVTLSSVVTPENLDQLPELGRLIRGYQREGGRLHAWHLYRFLPQGRGGECNASRFQTQPGEFELLGARLKEGFPQLRIYLRGDMYHSRQVGFYWKASGKLCAALPQAASA